MKHIYTLIVLLFLIQTVFAQITTSGINGQVKEENGYLPGATVLAIHLPSGTRYGTVTNIDGRFILTGNASRETIRDHGIFYRLSN